MKKVRNYIKVLLLLKTRLTLLRSSLIAIYKSFIRPHLERVDIIYGQPNKCFRQLFSNASFSDKIQSIQHNLKLAITSTIKSALKEKMYQELGLQTLRNRRYLMRLCYLYKTVSFKIPLCLYEIVPDLQRQHRNPGCFKPLPCWTEFFQNSFLTFTVRESNKLESHIRNFFLFE